MAIRPNQLSLSGIEPEAGDSDTPESAEHSTYRAKRLLRLAGEYRTHVGPDSILNIALDFFEGGIADRKEAIALAGSNRKDFSRAVVSRRAMFQKARKRRSSGRE
jgi:DNA-binding ferritin-like protein (Dps family)